VWITQSVPYAVPNDRAAGFGEWLARRPTRENVDLDVTHQASDALDGEWIR
jgi:hypothetical protein